MGEFSGNGGPCNCRPPPERIRLREGGTTAATRSEDCGGHSSRLFNRTWFNLVNAKHLVYNTCWEDPRMDRAGPYASPDDTVLVITSAAERPGLRHAAGRGNIPRVT